MRSSLGSPGVSGQAYDDVVYFMCEKKSPFTASWTLRRCAFDCETRYLYYSSKALSLSSPWKKVLKVTAVRVPAEADDFDLKSLFLRDNHTDGDRSERNLYLFTVEGLYRNNMAHTSPPSRTLPNALSFLRSHRGWPSKHSPRGDSFQHERTVTCTLRCDSVALLRAVTETMRDVLADDGLCPPVNEGLPPCDPRNGLRLAHIPLYLGQPFRTLERSVFYAFERGDFVGRSPSGEAGTAVSGGFLCLTDQMVLLMRSDGTVPRWAALSSLSSVEYNVNCAKLPFLALLTTHADAADMVFVPSPPLLTSEERRAFSGAKCVTQLVELLRALSVFVRGSLVIESREDTSPSVRAYIEQRPADRRPLRFAPSEGYTEPLALPLPKARLARLSAAARREAQTQRLEAAATAADITASHGTPAGIFDVGEIRMDSQHPQRRRGGQPPAPLAQAAKITPASVAGTCAATLVPAPAEADEDADSDIQMEEVAIPTVAAGAASDGNGNMAGDIDLSDSLDDLMDVDAAPTSSANGASGQGMTLEGLLNQSFTASPQ